MTSAVCRSSRIFGTRARHGWDIGRTSCTGGAKTTADRADWSCVLRPRDANDRRHTRRAVVTSSQLAEMEPSQGEVIWSTVFPSEVANAILDLVDG